jgi:dTDP-glucose pyrophosphorylase
MINVVIPIGGAGSRFARSGFTKTKPFIDVAGKAMIERVLENLVFPNANYIIIARRDQIDSELDLVSEIKKKYRATFILLDRLTEGTACSVLYARSLINNDTPLLIANSDQIVDFNLIAFIEDALARNLDGSILTFKDVSRNPKWSFALLDNSGMVQEVQEKKAISEFATVGIYLYNRGEDFVEAAIEMILQQDKVNSEYYTCPTYNYLIKANKKIGIYVIPAESMHGVGTPEDLQAYLEFLENSKK